jgi:hypothetical protein
MTTQIKLISFYNGFNYYDNFIIKLLKKYEINYEYSENNAEILFVGSFIKENDVEYIKNFIGKKILYITEPIDVCYKYTYELFKNDIFDIVFGCINENMEKKYHKYPLYIEYSYGHYLNDTYKNSNIKVLHEDLENKKFCTLINTHDRFNTRSKIYNLLKDIDKIDCPSLLFNNMTNQELNNIGNVSFINKYLFNLCSENTKCEFNGYITEKLMNCCLGGSIPIYFGSFDEIDEKIFNKDRIIFYDPYNYESIKKTHNIVNDLYNDKNKFEIFYKQKVFQDTVYDTIKYLEIKLIEEIKKLFHQ